MKAIIFDTETTGLTLPRSAPLEDQPRIIELGAILVEGSKIKRELSQLLNPELEISAEITKITRLTNADLETQPTFAEFLPELKKFFAGAAILVCHNAPFDKSLLEFELERVDALKTFPMPAQTICTVQEFRHMFGRRPRLIELYEKFMGKPLAQKHRALDDCKALHEVLVKTKFLDGLKK